MPSASARPKRPSPHPDPAVLGRVGYALKRLQWRFRREGEAGLAELGVSYPQWDVLRHLAHQPDASLHALAEATLQTDQSMGTLTKRMIVRGLIERVDGPGRAVHHRMTAFGRIAQEAGAQVMAQVLADSIGQLSSDELDSLLALLDKSNA